MIFFGEPWVKLQYKLAPLCTQCNYNGLVPSRPRRTHCTVLLTTLDDADYHILTVS